jgi:hypothetical protein
MEEQLAPLVSQRHHWKEYVIGAAPTHVPVVPVSVCPCFGVPLMVGFTVFAGAEIVTTPVAPDVAWPLPPTLVAVTLTRIVWLLSALASVYVLSVAPLMAAQAPPDWSQRSQRYVYVIGAVPVHVPFDAVNVEPTVADPLIVGSAVFAGGVAPETTPVFADACVAVPAELCAVTLTKMV